MELMRKMKLKVCGMREQDNVRAVADLNPDYMGFIFYPSSPRFAGNDFQFSFHLPTHIKKVGVFVNASSEEMQRQAARLGLSYLQLHGNEPVNQLEELKNAGVKLIKAFSIGDDFDFEITTPYQSLVDYFLFDTKGKLYGGNAKTFNWNLLERYNQKTPFFLSGGISADNVADIFKLSGMNIHAIDVNSGVELLPGIKDTGKIEVIKKLLNHE
jgi:phosphoribosylanthranilate isomerase